MGQRLYKTILGFVFCETIFYLFYTLPWALVFQAYISTTTSKKCQDPMWWWINFTNYYFWGASMWNVVSIPIRYNILRKEVKGEPKTKIGTFVELTKALQIIGGIACLVMLTKAYEHRKTCHALAPLVKSFLVWNLISIIIWCSGTYLVYVRLWNKALEWVKRRESDQDLDMAKPSRDYKSQIKKKNPEEEDDESPLMIQKHEEIPLGNTKMKKEMPLVQEEEDEEDVFKNVV